MAEEQRVPGDVALAEQLGEALGAVRRQLRRTAERLTGRMGTLVEDRSAALLVRVWLEDETEFRARLTAVDVVSSPGPGQEVTVAVASTPGDVIEAVRAWLDKFLGHAVDAVDSGE